MSEKQWNHLFLQRKIIFLFHPDLWSMILTVVMAAWPTHSALITLQETDIQVDTIYEQNWIEQPHACSTHLILSSPQVTWPHLTWRNHYWRSIYRSVRLFNHHTTISRRPLRKMGLRWIPAGHGCACCLLSSPSPLCLHQFFHIRKWVKAIASRSARMLFGISNIY